ncbi:ArsR/SmtB family transcription factor [Agrobacterium vitis]|uniref:ArsR/SmtB family transcription factor n=1 Tax=Agrobacterium vitis TaxID=373 RepID=UPI001F287FBC|nr:metalloregulator ArsR/SmtB family transcription factor [Agrobacterium vitis]WEO75068.1 metalloregulator ArsR/SmtB family transcription factor [Agrobacterium vitis]
MGNRFRWKTVATIERITCRSGHAARSYIFIVSRLTLQCPSHASCHIAQQERSVGEIQEDLGFKQPALSQQLSELRQAGVVQTRRESPQIYYSIADDCVAVVMTMLMQMFCGTLSTVVV